MNGGVSLPKSVRSIGYTDDGHTAIHYADGSKASLAPLEPGQFVSYRQVKPFSIVWLVGKDPKP